MNAELIKALRCCIVDFNSTQSRRCNECPYRIYADGKKACENKAKRDAADALEAAEKRIKELEDDLRNSAISNLERFKIYGYTVKDLILFAEICKRNNVKEEDMKQAAWNLELAVRAYRNSVIDGFKMEQTDKGTLSSYTLKPDFEKAFAEMRGEHDEQIH